MARLHPRTRFFSAPSHGKYALRVFSDPLGIPFPLKHHSAVKAAKLKRTRPLRQAPLMPLSLLTALEQTAVSNKYPTGLRLYCSLFCLMTYASLRFSDLRQVDDAWASGTAICGLSVNQKDRNGETTQWATPKLGITQTTFWPSPLLSFWKRIKPEEGRVRNLFPFVDNEWNIDFSRAATNDTSQAALGRIAKLSNLDVKCTLHSPRNRAATCAHQLRYPRGGTRIDRALGAGKPNARPIRPRGLRD